MKRFALVLLLVALVGCSRSQRLTTEDTLSDRDFAGYSIVNEAGEEFGRVASVVVDIETGTIEYVVTSITRGPFSGTRGGLSETPHPYMVVPWHALTLDDERHVLVLHASDEVLLHAPRFEALPNTTVADWDAEVQAYWTNP